MIVENPFADTDPEKVSNELNDTRLYLPDEGLYKLDNIAASLVSSEKKKGVMYLAIEATLAETISGDEAVSGATYSIAIELPRAEMEDWKKKRSMKQILTLFCAAFGKDSDIEDNRVKAVAAMGKMGDSLYDKLVGQLSGQTLLAQTVAKVGQRGKNAGKVFSHVHKFSPAED